MAVDTTPVRPVVRRNDPFAVSSTTTVVCSPLNFLNVSCAATMQSCRATNARVVLHCVGSEMIPELTHSTHTHSADADVASVRTEDGEEDAGPASNHGRVPLRPVGTTSLPSVRPRSPPR